MESTTYLKNLKIAPKKLRFIAGDIKRMSPVQATESLFYTQQKAAKVFYKAIKSAIANARVTLKVGDDLLQFKLLTIEEGAKMKRYNPGGRGTAKPYTKQYSHIKIVLVAKESPKEEEEVKVEPAEEVKTETKVEEKPKTVKRTTTRRTAQKAEKKA